MLKYRGAILTIVLTTVLLLFYFPQQLIQADRNNYAGDGFKNYYTVAWYLQHDSGSHFSGMNYPYGENIAFTDNQPALVWLLKPVVKAFPVLDNHIRLLIMCLIFLSIICAALFTFLTLRLMEMDETCAVLFTILITLMAPQIMRLCGHFSLAYTCFLPLVIYLLVGIFKEQHNKWLFVWLTFVLTFFAFIHPYYPAMAGMFILLTAIFFLHAQRWDIKSNYLFITMLAASAIIPIIALKSYLLITDNILDRPSNPWGFVDSCSTVPDIILSLNSFTGQAIKHLFPNADIVYHIEGASYIGLVSVITLLALVLIKLRGIFSKGQNHVPILPYPVNIFFPAAFVVLLFAMSVPFNFQFFEKYYHLLPTAIKQFRASGRFSWVFYYIATLTAALSIYQAYKVLLKGNKTFAYILLTVVFSVWFIEDNLIAKNHLIRFNKWTVKLEEQKQAQLVDSLLQTKGYSANDFQAVISFPFFLNGSEKLSIPSYSEYHAMNAAMFTGLPVAGGEMSRTSLSQTFKIANLLSSDISNKDILKEYHNKKPLLLLTIENTFSLAETQLLSRAPYLFSALGVNYYVLPLTAFEDSSAGIKQYFAQNQSAFFKHKGYLSNDSTDNVLLLGFEDTPQWYAAFGKGALYNHDWGATLYNKPLPNASNNSVYEFSIWLYADPKVAGLPEIQISQVDSTGKEYRSSKAIGMHSTDTFGKWARVQIDFTVLNANDTIRIIGQGTRATYDELMVRPQQVRVISSINADSSFSYNNFPIR